MFSKTYHDTVARFAEFHKQNKTWTGKATFQYAEEIKNLVEKHNAKSILDYGCGKALHYEQDSHVKIQDKTFQEYLGIESFYLFDPAVEKFSQLPPPDTKFDAVICIQSMPGVPDEDFPTVVKLLESYTAKFCFIGNAHPNRKVKEKKKQVGPGEATPRTVEWYQEQFKDWQGSELVLRFAE